MSIYTNPNATRVRNLKAGDVLLGSGFVVSHCYPSVKPGKMVVEGKYPKDTEITRRLWNANTTVTLFRQTS